MSAKSFTMYYDDLVKQFHVLYIEDPFSEDDWDGWTEITRVLSQKALIVADDLVATNPYRLQTTINKKAATSVIIKPTQIGTVIESLAVAEAAMASNMKIVVSGRSGETNDDFIADFAVAVGADYAKFGAPARGEHVAKYNRLLEINSTLQK
jgi:enolase